MLVGGRQGQLENVLIGMFFCDFSFLESYSHPIKTLSFHRSELNFI
jgi:hypothetical protein